MIFRYTIIYVADVGATLDFYRRAFGLEVAMSDEAGDYGELRTGETKLAFTSHALMRRLGKEVATTPPERPAYEVAFETEDVAGALARAVAAGAEQVMGVTQAPWGQTMAYVRAPEGTLVEICTAVG